MNTEATQFIQKAGRFSEADKALMEKSLGFRALKKGEILLDKGEICSQLSLITEGALYQYHVDTDLNENIIDLKATGDWILNHKSFTTRSPSEHYIRAQEDSQIVFLTIDSIHALIAKSQSFLQMGTILEEATSRVNFFDNNYTPDEGYQYLMDHNPILVQKYPQKRIASFLKISPETLSRVRSRLSKQ